MANKVLDITNSVSKYDILSQTPANYSNDNYYIKELQEKVNADWQYRPNRVNIEFEEDWGSPYYSPIEVVMQSVKSDKGEDISNDCRRIVFKEIREDRFRIGSKFRFAKNYQMSESEYRKDVWLVTNLNLASITSSVVIERCNGNIGSSFVDKQGVTHYHYESVIQGRELKSAMLRYGDPIITTEAQLIITCQYNEFTKDYFVNERFIIGTDQVYRITAINKYYSDSTFNSEEVGLMRIYLERTETSVYDDFAKRMAYQLNANVQMDTQGTDDYKISFIEPEYIPTDLTSEELLFKPVVTLNDETQLNKIPIDTLVELEGLKPGVSMNEYVEYKHFDDGSFSLSRKRIYLKGNLIITCFVKEEDSPTGESFQTQFKMSLKAQE